MHALSSSLSKLKGSSFRLPDNVIDDVIPGY